MSRGAIDFVQLTREYLLRNRSMGSHVFSLNGCDFLIDPEVFSPMVFEDTAFFQRSLKVPVGGDVLEIGCGAGVISVFAALNGARRVVATDISPLAVANAVANARLHHVDALLDVRVGDVFGALRPQEKFDLIFWNAPFIATATSGEDFLELAVFDPDYRSIQSYLAEGPRHLTAGGCLMLGFSSTSGDRSQIEDFAARGGSRLELRDSMMLSDETCSEFSLELYEVTGFTSVVG